MWIEPFSISGIKQAPVNYDSRVLVCYLNVERVTWEGEGAANGIVKQLV